MGVLLLPQQWRQQPQQAVPIDPSMRAAAAVNYNELLPINVVTGAGPILNGESSLPTLNIRRRGRGIQFDTNSAKQHDYTTNLSADFTLLAVATIDSGGAARRLLDDDAGTNRAFQFRVNSSNQAEFIRFNTGGTPYFATDGTALTSVELSNGFVMAAVSNGTALSVFANHRKTTGTLSGTPFTPNPTTTVGARKNGVGADAGAIIHFWVALPYAASDAFIHAFVDNPWQLFKATPRRIWVGASSGGPTIIDLTAASMSYSAKSQQTRLASTLTAAGLTTSAKAVQPRLDASLTAATMSIEAKAVQPATRITLTSAAMTYTAQSITTIRNTLIQLGSATLAFTARAIEVTGALAVFKSVLQFFRRRRR